MLETLRQDRQFWTPEQINELQHFFSLNPFFAPLYEHADFQEVAAMLFYANIPPGQQLRLQINLKSQAVLLLAGRIEVYRRLEIDHKARQKMIKSKIKIIEGHYYYEGTYQERKKVIQLHTDSILVAPQDEIAEVAFVPAALHDQYQKKVKKRRIDTTMEALGFAFPTASKLSLRLLAEDGCLFHETKMHGIIYRAGQPPDFCYILTEGSVKLESNGFSAKSISETALINAVCLFGERDINEEGRVQGAVCCSAHCRFLAVPKQAFIKFITRNPQPNSLLSSKIRGLASSRSKSQLVETKSDNQSHTLPRIPRFRSMTRNEEGKIQKQLYENCHMLIDLSPTRRARSSFRKPQKVERDHSVSQFQNKVRLFQRMQRRSGLPLEEGLGMLKLEG